MKRSLACLFVPILLALGLLLAVASTQADSPLTPADFLKQSMSQYQKLTSFQAQCGWNETFGGAALPQKAGADADVRTILYVSPNQFKVISAHSGGSFTQTSVSDGKTLVEYSSMARLGAMTYASPATFAGVSSMQMTHPMFCGSLLYQFFGGSDNLKNMADTSKTPITYGPDVTVDGEPCKTVDLYGKGLYGHAEIAISTRDFLVRRIVYDSAPLMAMMGTVPKPSQMKMPKGFKMPTSSSTTEEYRQISVDQPISAGTFDTTVPKGQSVTDMSRLGDSTPPVPVGSLAPGFTVSSLRGLGPTALSSQRGHVVLLDFWATWCPPCRKSLPETQALSMEFKSRGLTVMAISDETEPVIAKFLKSNHYTFPAYRDGGGSANKAYKVMAIPTLAIIDREGRLSAYLVGLQERSTVVAALKKAGL